MTRVPCVQRVSDILSPHRAAQPPRNDVAGEVIQNVEQIEPTPADDLEVGEVGLPHLVGAGGLGLEIVRSFHHDIGRTTDQIMAFKSL